LIETLQLRCSDLEKQNSNLKKYNNAKTEKIRVIEAEIQLHENEKIDSTSKVMELHETIHILESQIMEYKRKKELFSKLELSHDTKSTGDGDKILARPMGSTGAL